MADRVLDHEVEALDHRVGTLSVDGKLKGHLACVVGRLLGGAPWPWFVIVWTDGSREHSFEDYGPNWHTVRELNAGYLEHHGPSAVKSRSFLGLKYDSITTGPPARFDFAWLGSPAAEAMWMELGLKDDDF